MNRIIALVVLIFLSYNVIAQQKDFEGVMVYRVAVQSKSEFISDRVLKTLLAVGNDVTIWLKHGNYRQISGISDIYFICKDQKVYFKFKNLDTLYYLDYNSDTTVVTKVSKSNEKKNIAGYDCSLLTVKSPDITRQYYYSPSLYMDPEYDRNNTIGRYDAFAKETSSLYLEFIEDAKGYTASQTCTKVRPTAIPDSVFELPKLPQKIFVLEELTIPPEFTKAGGWAKYIETSVDKEVGAKYVRIPKGEELGSEKVIVKFMINEYGRVAYAEVENKKEVNSKLAEEALRVVNASPLWKPATVYGGEKTIFWLRLPIVFQATRK